MQSWFDLAKVSLLYSNQQDRTSMIRLWITLHKSITAYLWATIGTLYSALIWRAQNLHIKILFPFESEPTQSSHSGPFLVWWNAWWLLCIPGHPSINPKIHAAATETSSWKEWPRMVPGGGIDLLSRSFPLPHSMQTGINEEYHNAAIKFAKWVWEGNLLLHSECIRLKTSKTSRLKNFQEKALWLDRMEVTEMEPT